LNDVLENKKQPRKRDMKRAAENKKAFKDAKYGFGGQKKRSKMNTAQSSAAGFGGIGGGGAGMKKQGGARGKRSGFKGGKNKQKRAGKSKRMKSKKGKGKG